MKRSVKDFLKPKKTETDENGNVILYMVVKDDDGFLSPFSKNSAPVISSDVADFIESQTESFPPKTGFVLHVHSDCIDASEQDVYRDSIRAYYTERFLAAKHSLRRNLFVALFLALLGVLTLTFAVLTELFHVGSVWNEVVDIVAWVLLWESVDISLFRNHSLFSSRKRYLAFLSMDVKFFKEKTL